ncbi:enolase N-terminal-like fold-containing protein [Myxococcota bacterium]
MNRAATVERASTVQRLIAGLTDAARAATVADVRIGLGYNAVELTDERTGMAYTFRDQAQGGCSVFDALRPLTGRSAADLLPLLESRDVIEDGVGLACANALANRNHPAQVEGNILDHLAVEASGEEPDATVRSFLEGRLETGANLCDH